MTQSESIYDSPVSRLAVRTTGLPYTGASWKRLGTPSHHQSTRARSRHRLWRGPLDGGASVSGGDCRGPRAGAGDLSHSRVVDPGALFWSVGPRLALLSGAFDLIAAAGALNYVDVDLFLPDAVRVLAPGGVLIIYDFRRVGMLAKATSWTSGSPRLRAAIPHRPATSPTSRVSPITGPDCGWSRTQSLRLPCP